MLRKHSTVAGPALLFSETDAPYADKNLMWKILKFSVCTFVLFTLAGIIWGLIQPLSYVDIQDIDGQLAVFNSVDSTTAAFTSFLVSILVISVVALCGTYAGYILFPALRGIGFMIYLALLFFLAESIYIFLSNRLLATRDTPRTEELITAGAHISFNPPIEFGSAVLVAPFLAVLVYWLLILFSSNTDFYSAVLRNVEKKKIKHPTQAE